MSTDSLATIKTSAVPQQFSALPTREDARPEHVVRLLPRLLVLATATGAAAWAIGESGSTSLQITTAVALLVIAPAALQVGTTGPVRRPIDLVGTAMLLLAAVAVALPSGFGPSPAISALGASLGVASYAALRAAAPRGRRILCMCGRSEFERLQDAVTTEDLRYVAPYGDVLNSTTDDLEDLVAQTHPDLVVLGASQLSDPGLGDRIARLYMSDVHVRTVGECIEELGGRVPVQHLSVRWFLPDVMGVHNRAYRAMRFVVDRVVGAVGVVLLLLILPLLATAIKLDSPGPVFYRQERVGRAGRTFWLVKFRTMRSDAEACGPCFATESDPRVTRVGRFLRHSRLDEVPQLWNVLRGDMTLIGPRPERPEFVTGQFGEIPYYEFRHIVRPGVTGWAQVTEGYTSDLAGAVRKLERDLYYLRHQSLLLDLRVLVLTVACVLRMAGR